MSSSRFSIVLLFIVVNLSSQQNGSSAFIWTTDIYRKIRKNPSRFHLFSINTAHQKTMRQRPGLDGMRMAASNKASSMSIDDGNNDDDDSKDRIRQLSTYSTYWWRKDPRNRSVSGILICTL